MKKHSICWLDFIIGAMAASMFWLFIYAAVIVPDVYTAKGATVAVESDTTVSEENVETSIKQYNTSVKNFKMSWDNGDSVELFAPSGFSSLTDQYLDEMSEYYSTDISSMPRTYIVGDSDSSNQCTVMLNASALSDVSVMLNNIYGDDADNSHVYSEAYCYMRDGVLPDELPDGYRLVDLGSLTVGSSTYRVFDIRYDVTYTYYAEDDTAKANPLSETITYYELAAYSSTQDPVEIITYMTDYDTNSAYKYLCEFIGYEFSGTVSEGTVVVDNSVVEEEMAEDGH